MGAVVFDNLVFDSWLTKKSDEILFKVDKEKITTEEMLTLILKAQTNHFHHMDVEFRAEFKSMEFRMDKIDGKFGILETRVHDKFSILEARVDDRITKLETKILNFQKWHVGIMVALFAGIYMKLFLG